MIPVVLDMETADPDDAITLCFAASHPDVNLLAVTVTPGTNAQIGVVREVLSRCGLKIPVGARKPGYEKPCVSGFHYNWLGEVKASAPDASSSELLLSCLKSHPDLTLFTGGPPGVIGQVIPFLTAGAMGRWVAQGGFAGDLVVPEGHRLAKFNGLKFCPTFNFNGAKDAVLLALGSNTIKRRVCVSKDICHGTHNKPKSDGRIFVLVEKVVEEKPGTWTLSDPFDEHGLIELKPSSNPARKLMLEGLGMLPDKMLHDLLAFSVVVDESVVTLSEVVVRREKGVWGSQPATGTNTWISTSIRTPKWHEVLNKTV